MRDYKEFPELALYFFEESYVLDISARPGCIIWELDLALNEEHPQFEPAVPDERHCYRRGVMEMEQVSELHWLDQGTPPAVDATGEKDYGSFDLFSREGDVYLMVGDFGEIRITASRLTVRLQ